MNLLDEITQLGQFIRVRIEKADRASGLAHDHYLAAGLELKKAKTLIQKTPELTWPQFVKMHCGIGQSRADELIALADGKITYEELRKRKRKSSAATYKKYRDAASAASSGSSLDTAAAPSNNVHESPAYETPNRLTLALQAYDALDQRERAEFLLARHLSPTHTHERHQKRPHEPLQKNLMRDHIDDSGRPIVLTRAQAAKMCNISLSTFDAWVRKGIVPGPIVGTRRWSRSAVERALARDTALGSEVIEVSPYEKWKSTHAH